MSLHVHSWGDPGAPPVVCLHGIRGHGGGFQRLAERRLSARYRVVALDLLGHGRSDWDPPWRLDAHLEALVETTERLGIERAAWMGHSFGGRLVLELAARDPDRVKRAILLDPAIWAPPPVALERAELARAEESYENLDEAIERRIVVGNLHQAPREWLEEDLAAHLETGPDGRLRYRFCPSAVVTALAELAVPPPPLDSCRVPTLMIHGAESDVVPEVMVELVRDGYGGAIDIVAVPGGHNVLWDAFDETAGAIESFLAAR
jgi:lipase